MKMENDLRKRAKGKTHWKHFLIGFASIFNIWPSCEPPPPNKIKLGTIEDDWKKVGGDMKKAIGAIKNEPSSNPLHMQPPHFQHLNPL